LDLPFRAGGDGERDDGEVENETRIPKDCELGAWAVEDGISMPKGSEGLRPRRFGGGERDRERLDDTSRLDLTLWGAGERERDRDAELYDALRPRPHALLRAGEGLRVYDRPRELDRESARLRRTGERDLERLDDVYDERLDALLKSSESLSG
jgi:hypothetical protein